MLFKRINMRTDHSTYRMADSFIANFDGAISLYIDFLVI
ncbi:hypothetical protein VRK_35340 [Vibrio sp. MEBiC08052]|nr:hypothetical protein VRK_35340 [Vibrio sp. MEBiC08052]